jgi:hypothetical protein
MAEAHISAVNALDEASQIVRGAPRAIDAQTPKASPAQRQGISA